jgi:serine/threonine protein phosphatase PrpC
MQFIFACRSDVGRVHTHNEDYIWIDENKGIFIIADGLGGHEAGEKASELTATTVGQMISDGLVPGEAPLSTEAVKSLMVRALEVSNEAVLAAANEEGQKRKMGATIVVILVQLPQVYICHAGDARVYLAREMTLTQITEDDSFVAQLVAAGVISEDEAKTHIYHSVVTKAIGQSPPLEPTFTKLDVVPKDWLLMCSDGLTDMVNETQIMSVLQAANGDPDYVVNTLTSAANDAGGKDNISVIAIRVLADED